MYTGVIRLCDDPVVNERISIPGFVNAHSHAFQRALRGRAAGSDFWSWREAMLEEAARQTPETVRALYADVYREMLAAGYTAVGEFHYLGLAEAVAAAEAAEEAGIAIVVVLAAYARGGLPRFRQASVREYLASLERLRTQGVAVAVAPHSVRACPPEWLAELGAFAAAESLPLHVHACEQPREITECVAEYGMRPIELLAANDCLGPRTTVVHATHASDAELDLLADAGARICACPTTEANLGDGFLPIDRICDRTIGVCIGSDSNVRIDPLEELREIEGVARRVKLARNVVSVDSLLAFGSDEGAAALGLHEWRDVEIDTTHRSLRGVPEDGLYEALVLGCGADVLKTPLQ
jgi:formimidoylglutamate deiminase